MTDQSVDESVFSRDVGGGRVQGGIFGERRKEKVRIGKESVSVSVEDRIVNRKQNNKITSTHNKTTKHTY